MNRYSWLKGISLIFFVVLSWGLAKDNGPKLEDVTILSLDTKAMTLTVADMTFWVDTKTKIEDNNSNHISFSDLSVGAEIELWYDELQSNADGFSYASKIEVQ
jgi:Domain of unknown function (DUF5666)